MAKGIRALLDTVMQALPQVGNLGLLFFLLFFIFAALGVELFGRLECSDEMPCQGLGEHAHFSNFGMAFLTLFRVATGDNWNGIMKDTLRDNCDDSEDCVKNCCVSSIIAPIFFVIFVLMAQFVLVNVVVAVLMKHLEESHKQMEDELDMESQLERELLAEQEELLVVENEENEEGKVKKCSEEVEIKPSEWTNKNKSDPGHGLSKVHSLPSNFIYNHGQGKNQDTSTFLPRDRSNVLQLPEKPSKSKNKQKQSLDTQKQNICQPPQFEVLGPIKIGSSDLSADNCSSIVVSNTSNYLFPPTISYTSKGKDISAERQKFEKNISLKTSCAENCRRNSIRNTSDKNTNLLVKKIGDDFDVQSIINERRPLKLKTNSPQFLDSHSNGHYFVPADKDDNASINMVKEHSDGINNLNVTDLKVYVDDIGPPSSKRFIL